MFDPERRRVEGEEIIELGPQDEILEPTDLTHEAIAHRKKQPVEVSRNPGPINITERKLSALNNADAENDNDPMEEMKKRQAPDK